MLVSCLGLISTVIRAGRAPLTKATLSFHGKNVSAYPREKSGGDTCADVAVARPSRRWTGCVQILSREQKSPEWFSRPCQRGDTSGPRAESRTAMATQSVACGSSQPGPPPRKERWSLSERQPAWRRHARHAPSRDPWVSECRVAQRGSRVALPAGPGLGGQTACLSQTV